MEFVVFWLRHVELFVLVFLRTVGIFTLTPIFGAQQVPSRVKVVIALALSFAFVPIVHPVAVLPSDTIGMAIIAARETLIGLVIGFVSSLVFTAIQIAGDFIDLQSGFSSASMFDPASNANSTIAARFQRILAGLLFFVTNSHHIMLRALADSFRIAPVGQLTFNPAISGSIWLLFTTLFTVAIRIAIPIVAAGLLADVALAIASRLIPNMNVFMVGLPLRMGVALVGLLVVLPMMLGMNDGLFSNMYQYMTGTASMVAGN
jgi:flagellar biosynthetic protein FliR